MEEEALTLKSRRKTYLGRLDSGCITRSHRVRLATFLASADILVRTAVVVVDFGHLVLLLSVGYEWFGNIGIWYLVFGV